MGGRHVCMYACSMHLFMHLFKQCPCTFCSMMNWSCLSNILSEPHAAFKPGHKPPQVTTVATMSSHHLKQTREIRGAMKSGASTVLGLEMEHRPTTSRTHVVSRFRYFKSKVVPAKPALHLPVASGRSNQGLRLPRLDGAKKEPIFPHTILARPSFFDVLGSGDATKSTLWIIQNLRCVFKRFTDLNEGYTFPHPEVPPKTQVPELSKEIASNFQVGKNVLLHHC